MPVRLRRTWSQFDRHELVRSIGDCHRVPPQCFGTIDERLDLRRALGVERTRRIAKRSSVEYLDLADYTAIAAAVIGLELPTVMNLTNHDLADSALHALAAGIGDTDFYPDSIVKAAVLVVRLARNHPLPDGNKRAASVSLRHLVLHR